MREIVDRDSELALLRSAAGDAPALIVLIGRRRVGKSFLVDRAFTGKRVVAFQGDEQRERQHLDLLAREAGRVLLGTEALSFADWDQALSFFGEQARKDCMSARPYR